MADLPTPGQCEEMFHAALAAGDARGVEAALMVMAPQDPHRAQRLLDTTRLALVAAVDAMVGDRPEPAGKHAPTGPDNRTNRDSDASLPRSAARPAPEPDSGTGWDRSAVEALLARSGADATDHELRQVVALLADRDMQASDAVALRRLLRRAENGQRYAEAGRNATGTKLGEVCIELEDVRAELAEVTAERDRLQRQQQAFALSAQDSAEYARQGWAEVEQLRAELATARRDAAAGTPVPKPKVTPGHPTRLGVAGYDCMCGECQALRAEPVPGQPEPATNQEPTTEVQP